MAEKAFIMDLARLVVSAAWADGQLTNSELNALKDLLFTIEDVTGEDWKQLEIYMDSPVSEQETQELLERVVSGIRNAEDKTLVLETLRRLFSIDGTVTPEEKQLLDEIEASVSEAGTGILARFAKAVKSAIGRRSEKTKSSSLRETDMEDYAKNTVYYQLQQAQEAAGVAMDLPDERLRKLCLATGILAHVANVDEDMAAAEREAMRDIIAADWELPAEQADLLVRVGCDRTTKGLDYFRLSHGFFDATSHDERKAFVQTLFRVANAAGKTSNEEIETIRRISKSLRVSHQDFIDAKLTIPREDRKGL